MGGPGVGVAGDPSDLNSERPTDYWHAHMNTVAGNEAIVVDGSAHSGASETLNLLAASFHHPQRALLKPRREINLVVVVRAVGRGIRRRRREP